MKLLKIVIIATIIILAIMLVKYKVVYKVTILGEEIGYVSNKNEFEKIVNEQILNPQDENIAYVDIEELPTYEIIFASNTEQTNEEEVLTQIAKLAQTTYKVYAVAVNGDNTVYVNTQTEAEETVEQLKEEYKEKIDEIDITVNEVYTKDVATVEETVELASAVEVASEEVEVVVEEQEKIKSATLDGVYFSVKPVSGTITSRYGANESIRDHTHKGLDIAAPYGTKIVAAASGTVSYSGWMSGYGNLIIINHENGIQTYYGHCSKLLVTAGQTVSAGEIIAKVGSTGRSTGSHLHFEIRINGGSINPQGYIGY